MDLTERIARLIDPEVWETADYLRVIELPLTAQKMTESSLIAARRIIDGLHLIDTATGEARTEEPAPRVRQIYEEDM